MQKPLCNGHALKNATSDHRDVTPLLLCPSNFEKHSHVIFAEHRCRHFSVSPAALRFEDPQETALLLADAPRTRAIGGAERNDARSGSSLAKEFAILRMQASARPRLASAGLSSFVCR